MTTGTPKKGGDTPRPVPNEPSGEDRQLDTEALEPRQAVKKAASPQEMRDSLFSSSKKIDEALARQMAEAINWLDPKKVNSASNKIKALDAEQDELLSEIDALFNDLEIDPTDGSEPLTDIIDEPPIDPDELATALELLKNDKVENVIEIVEEKPEEEKPEENKQKRLAEMSARIDQQMAEEDQAELNKDWDALRDGSANPTTIKNLAHLIVEDPSNIQRLQKEFSDLDRGQLLRILKRASEDSMKIVGLIGKGEQLTLTAAEQQEIMENRTDYETWRTTWNIMVDTIRDAEPNEDIESQLNELGDMLTERPDRLELLLGTGETENGAKALDNISLVQRQTVSERLRVYGFTNKEENIKAVNALVLEHPERFRDIYNTLPVSKQQTEQLLSSIPEGEIREKVMREMHLKIDQTKWNAKQVQEQTKLYEQGPDSDNRAVIESLQNNSQLLYEAAQKTSPELAAIFSSGEAFLFADAALKNAQTNGKRMVDVAGPILKAQELFEEVVEQAETDPSTNADLSELKAALAEQRKLVEQTQLAAEKELAVEFEATRAARQELYDAIKEENPAAREYIEERERVEQRLYDSQITEVQDLGDDSGITAPTRNYFDDMVLPAVGKAASKELRAVMTPETFSYGYSLKAESMTNDLAVALGKRNVVPSVDRMGPEGATNFQEWYPSEPLDNIPWGDLARRNEGFAKKLEDVVEVRALVRDIDGHDGNMKRLHNGDIVTIDHGQAFISARPENVSNEPYNYFRCYALWAVGGRQMNETNRNSMRDLFKSKKQSKTRAALQKLFQIRFGAAAEQKWMEMESRADKMITEGLPQVETSPHPMIQQRDEDARNEAYVAGR